MQKTFIVIIVLIAILFQADFATAGKYNPVLSIGDAAPAWKNLPGVDGKKHSLSDLKSKHYVILVFTCLSCDVARDYEDRIIAFTAKHAGPKSLVAVVAVNVNKIPEDLPPQMKKRAKEKGYNFPFLYDETQQIAKDYGAIFTPEFYVLNKDRKVVYMGGMDNNSSADQVTEKYLEPALTAILAGKKPKAAETAAIGCIIRLERKRRRKK